MKKRIVSLLLSLLLCFSLGTTALAAGGFDATVTVDRETEGYICVTVSADDAILSTKKPTLTVPCDFKKVEVLFDGEPIDYELDLENRQVSFTVAAKGTYDIVGLFEVTVYGGAEKYGSGTYTAGTTVEIFAGGPATGYTFSNWITEDVTVADVNSATTTFTMPTKDVTVTANWERHYWTVKYESNGGTAIDDAVFYYGEAVTAPTAPTKSGYTFGGWYCDESLTTRYEFTETVTMDEVEMTLFAKWKVIYYEDPTPVVPSTEPETPTVDTSAPTVSTETTENADGTTTITEIKANGVVVETTKNADGTTITTATKTEITVTAAGTVTTTVSNTTTADATGTTATETKVEEKVETATGTTTTTTTTTETTEKTETVEIKEETVITADGTEVTTTTSTTETELANGSTGTTTMAADGSVTAEVTLSKAAVSEAAAADAAVTLAMPAVEATTSTETAAVVIVTTNTTEEVTVEVPVANVTAGTVAVIVNEDGTETVVQTCVPTENGVAVAVPDGAVIKIVDNSTDFEDLEESDWESDAVDFVSARGIMNGTGTETAVFNPDTTTTRAQVWTMLARLDGVDTAAGETWYEAGQKWAMEKGISDGTNHDAEVTREQLITMIWRYLGEPESDHDISHFEDHHETSDWAMVAKKWAVENGVISSMGDGSLNPGGDATRAQVAQMFYNFMANL